MAIYRLQFFTKSLFSIKFNLVDTLKYHDNYLSMPKEYQKVYYKEQDYQAIPMEYVSTARVDIPEKNSTYIK